MRFAQCALAFLVVACIQTGSIEAQFPSNFEDWRISLMAFLTNLKDAIQRSLNHKNIHGLDKVAISEILDKTLTNIQIIFATVSPFIDELISRVSEVTTGLWENFIVDIAELYVAVRPRAVALEQVLVKQFQGYYGKLQPKLTPMYNRKIKNVRNELQDLRVMMEPVVEELRENVWDNVEQVKNDLIPIIEAVRGKLVKRLEDVRNMVTPYIEQHRSNVLEVTNIWLKKIAKLDILAEKLSPSVTEASGIIFKFFFQND